MTVIMRLSLLSLITGALLCASCFETKTPYDSYGFEWGVIHADRLVLLIENTKGIYTRGYTGSGFQNNRELRYYAVEYKWPLDAGGSNPAKCFSLLYENHGEHLISFSRENLLSLVDVKDLHAITSKREMADTNVLEFLNISVNELFATAEKADNRYLLLRNGTIVHWDTTHKVDIDTIVVREGTTRPNDKTKWLVDTGQLVFFPYTVGVKSPPNIRFFPNKVTVFNYEDGENNVFTLENIGADDLRMRASRKGTEGARPLVGHGL